MCALPDTQLNPLSLCYFCLQLKSVDAGTDQRVCISEVSLPSRVANVNPRLNFLVVLDPTVMVLVYNISTIIIACESLCSLDLFYY